MDEVRRGGEESVDHKRGTNTKRSAGQPRVSRVYTSQGARERRAETRFLIFGLSRPCCPEDAKMTSRCNGRRGADSEEEKHPRTHLIMFWLETIRLPLIPYMAGGEGVSGKAPIDGDICW